MNVLNVNTDSSVILTNKLERMRRHDLPLAIRGTLNSAAFDMKKRTIERSTDETFTKRRKNFFKSKSRVFKASGFDIKTMKSTVGFVGDDQAIDNLEKQEEGGQIGGRSYIPKDPARVSRSQKKMVRANARLSKIKKIVNPANVSGANKGQRFVKSVIFAGKGGHVLGELQGKEILWRVNSLNRDELGRFKLTPLYSYKSGRKVNVDSTHFMQKAADYTTDRMDEFYFQNAQRRFEKALR